MRGSSLEVPSVEGDMSDMECVLPTMCRSDAVESIELVQQLNPQSTSASPL